MNNLLFLLKRTVDVWLNDALVFISSTPVDVAYAAGNCTIVAKRHSWISVKRPSQMNNFACNGEPLSVIENERLSLIRFAIKAGESVLTWDEETR